MEKTILDQDIEIWTATVEHYTAKLRRCLPNDEWIYKTLQNRAQTVLLEMIVFKAFAEIEKQGRA